MKKFFVFTMIVLILFSSSPVLAFAGFGTAEQPVLSAEQICAKVKEYIASHPEAEDDLNYTDRIVIGSWYSLDDRFWEGKTCSDATYIGQVIFLSPSTPAYYANSTSGKGISIPGTYVSYNVKEDGTVIRNERSSSVEDMGYFVNSNIGIKAKRKILLSTRSFQNITMNGVTFESIAASPVPDSMFGGISYDASGSYTAAATSVIHDTYFTLQCKFKSFDDKLNYSIGYCLPSNQYAKDLVSDLNGFLSGRIYTPIVSSSGYKKTYQKSQSIQKTVTFDYAIENWLYPETKVEQLVDGSYTAIFNVPYDKQELGTSALAGCPLSNISSYPNYQDRLVASGYVDSITSYVLSVENQQGPVHVFKYDDKLNYITNYQICQEVGSITEEINKEKEHEAYIEEVKNRAEENNKILDDKFLNDNMWKNGFESMKDFVSSGLTYVSSFAALIGGFLSFMPPWFVGFLYSAMVASIVIGIIKIIRG